jgi:uncharacterized protein with HEPN domain
LKAGRDHLDYLQDIMTMMEKIESFTAGMTKEDFIEDYMAHFAVIRAMEVMGEAAKNVPPDVRQKHPEIPWKKMAGLRDKVIHGYFGVDLFIILESATKLIPGYRPVLLRILNEETEKCKKTPGYEFTHDERGP